MNIKKYLLAILVSLVFIVIPKDALKVQAEDITLGYSNPLGDMNYDNSIDVLDVMTLKDELLNDSFDRRGRYTADLNIDNEVTYMDVMLLKKAVLDLYSIINGYGGYCGDHNYNKVEDVKYFYNEDTKTLIFCGDGFIENFDNEMVWYDDHGKIAPWNDLRNKIEHAVISGNVKNVNYGCFNFCKNLVDVYMPNVSKIEYKAFSHCKSLKKLDISDNVRFIDRYAFQGCSSLETVNLDADIVQIDEFTFEGCTNLKTLNITNKSIKRIDESAFAYCGLTEVTIPESVNVVCYGAFSYCQNLTKVMMSKDTEINTDAWNDKSIVEGRLANCPAVVVRY